MNKHLQLRTSGFAALGFAVLFTGGPAVRRTVASSASEKNTPSPRQRAAASCLSPPQIEGPLSSASSMLEQNRFGEAASLLQSQSQQKCDYRIDLLLAAAFEGNNDLSDAERTLRRASSIWPSNCSVAASLARYHLQAGNTAGAKTAVSRCVPTSATSQRELRVIALVYLENSELERGRRIAAIAWQREPLEENLLFLANILQLQGRYMDVISLLQAQRHTYDNSPGFLITLAESESDGKLYPAAQRDLQHALNLDAHSYPTHYVLGHLLVATGHVAEGI